MRRLKLDEYSAKELRKLHAEVSAELALRQTARSGERDALLRVWHAAIDEVLRAQQGISQSYQQWKRGGGRSAVAHVVAAERLAGSFFPEKPRAIAVHPARVVMVEALVVWMRAREIPRTFGTLATQLQNVGAAVEASYPGYYLSGLLHLALARRDFEGE